MDSPIDFTSNSPEETYNIGQWLASKITASPSWNTDSPNFIIALSGGLGSGKTSLAKGIAAGVGIADIITSPTYTIINEYVINLAPNNAELKRNKYNDIPYSLLPAPCSLYHIDAYRLNDEKDFIDIGGNEILSSNGICIIEWADKIKNLLPHNAIFINIEIMSIDCRKITIKNKEGIEVI